MIAHFPVGELADMIHARDNPWKALFMTIGFSYVDDSGTHRDSVVTVIGGYVTTKTVWQQIEPQWRAILNEFNDKGLHCFHAKDCLWQWGQFERLQKVECFYVYKQLSDILEKSDVQAIWAGVRNADWEAVVNPDFKLLFKSPYDFCVDRVIREIMSWSLKFGGGKPVGIVVAMQKEHRAETDETHASWIAHKLVSEMIGPVAHEFPDRLVPLQAADMMAHEVYRHGTWLHRMEHPNDANTPKDEPTHPKVFFKIMRGNRIRMGNFYEPYDLEQIALDIRSEPA